MVASIPFSLSESHTGIFVSSHMMSLDNDGTLHLFVNLRRRLYVSLLQKQYYHRFGVFSYVLGKAIYDFASLVGAARKVFASSHLNR